MHAKKSAHCVHHVKYCNKARVSSGGVSCAFFPRPSSCSSAVLLFSIQYKQVLKLT